MIWDGDILEGSIDLAPSRPRPGSTPASMEISQSKYHEYQVYSSPQIGTSEQITRDGAVMEKQRSGRGRW